MPRKKFIQDDFCPYHVTARGNNKEPFPLDLKTLWSIFNSECLNQTITSGAEIHALVLMPNHFHLILTTPEDNLGVVMSKLLSYVTKEANLRAGRSGPFATEIEKMIQKKLRRKLFGNFIDRSSRNKKIELESLI